MIQIGYVYSIYNTKNKKRYIGQCADINARIRTHLDKHTNKYLSADINKYGASAFVAILHDICFRLEDRIKEERRLIKFYKTWDLQYGYNRRDTPPETRKWVIAKLKNKGKSKSQISKEWYSSASAKQKAKRMNFFKTTKYKIKISKIIKKKWRNGTYRKMMLQARLK